MRILLIILMAISMISCGSGGEDPDGTTTQFTQDVMESDPGEYPDCTGTYSMIAIEGNACQALNPLESMLVTQDHELLEFEHYPSPGRAKSTIEFIDNYNLENLMGYVGEFGIIHAEENGVSCWITVFVDHGITTMCSKEGKRCLKWFRKEPVGTFNVEDYPPVMYSKRPDGEIEYIMVLY